MVFDETRDCKSCYSHLVCAVYNPNFDNYAPECNLYMGKDEYEKVVRCKDCKFADNSCAYGLVCIAPCGMTGAFVADNDFCSSGKKKED